MAQTVGYTLAAIAPSGLGLLHDATGSWTVPLVTVLAVTGGALGFGLAAARDRKVV
jgi:CP family cyanate transporter-like MFS transporter